MDRGASRGIETIPFWELTLLRFTTPTAMSAYCKNPEQAMRNQTVSALHNSLLICSVPLDPAPNLVHHHVRHMTSHGIGGGSGLLAAFYGHKEVAQAGIHNK